jgi:hypothetical protein
VSDLELRVFFRDSAWRWRLGAHDEVELWTGPKLLGAIPGSMMTDIIRSYINGLALLAHFQAKLEAGKDAPIPPEGPSPELRRDRRAARRKPLKKALVIGLVTALGLVAGCAAHYVLVHPASERAHAAGAP